MTVLIVVIVASWVVFSAFLVTAACMNSSRISQLEEPARQNSTLARSRQGRPVTQLNPKTAPIQVEI